jgi:hypothetical protein
MANDFALMFNVLEGGVSEPIKWGKEQLQPNRSIIILDEMSQSLFLWHGISQGLVARRTALRQAESLKGHGYTLGKSIIGRDIKTIKEIDQRKVTRDPETDELNDELQQVLNKEFKVVEEFVVTFGKGELVPLSSKPTAKPKPKPQPKVETELKPKVEVKVELPKAKEAPKAPKPVAVGETDLKSQAKIAFVLLAITDHYNDIWVSKKDDGSFAVEMMDGPIATFKLANNKINFTKNSFTGINPEVKTAIQKKFVEFSKLL